MNTSKDTRSKRHHLQIVVVGLFALVAAGLLSGCEITDPAWQVRQNGPGLPLSAGPPPPRQWSPLGYESRQMRDYDWP